MHSYFTLSLIFLSSTLVQASPYPAHNGVPYKTVTKTITKTTTSTHTNNHIFTAYATITDTANCPFTTPTDVAVVKDDNDNDNKATPSDDADKTHFSDLKRRSAEPLPVAVAESFPDTNADAKAYANPDALPLANLPDEFNDMLAAAPAEILAGRQRRAFQQRGATLANNAAVVAPGNDYYRDGAAGRTKTVSATETAVKYVTVNKSWTSTVISVVSGCPSSSD